MRHPMLLSHGLMVATAVLFWIAASAARLQAADAAAGEPAATATAVVGAPDHVIGAPVVLAPAEFNLADHAGKVVVLDFWASWCKPCKLSMPWLSGLQRKYAEQGLQIVAVSVDTDEKAMRAHLPEIDPGIIVVFDPKGQLAQQYKIGGMPTTCLIDRAGRQAATHVGFLESKAAGREAEIVELLGKGK